MQKKEEHNIPPEITHKDISANSAKELEEEGLVTLQKREKQEHQKLGLFPTWKL